MKTEKLQDWLQIGGIFGVIGSLTFVGLQMKQTQEIALSNTYQARANASMVLRLAPTESPEFLSATTKLINGEIEDLTPDQITYLQFWFYGNLAYLENNHFQYVSGFLSEEQWQSNVGDLRFLFSYDLYRSLWEEYPGDWRDSFEDVIEKVLVELDDEAKT
jgi:hypothetical protein